MIRGLATFVTPGSAQGRRVGQTLRHLSRATTYLFPIPETLHCASSPEKRLLSKHRQQRECQVHNRLANIRQVRLGDGYGLELVHSL
jgi:hypothetical protein